VNQEKGPHNSVTKFDVVLCFSSSILGAQAKVCRAVSGTCKLRDFSFLINRTLYSILLNDVLLFFLCQALAEAQKGKEQALVDSVSFGYTLSVVDPV